MTCAKCQTQGPDLRVVQLREPGRPTAYAAEPVPWCAKCRKKARGTWKYYHGPNPEPAADDETLDKVALLLLTLRDLSTIRRACIERLDLTAAQTAAAITDARLRITLAHVKHHDKALAESIEQTKLVWANS